MPPPAPGSWLPLRPDGSTALARSVNSRTASNRLSDLSGGSCRSFGVAKDGTRYTYSPTSPSGSRLVTSTFTSGVACKTASANCAACWIRYSQFSRISSKRLLRKQSLRISARDLPASWRTPNRAAAGLCRDQLLGPSFGADAHPAILTPTPPNKLGYFALV